jgi:hypothetical protein
VGGWQFLAAECPGNSERRDSDAGVIVLGVMIEKRRKTRGRKEGRGGRAWGVGVD